VPGETRLVPVSESGTLRRTVEYAVQSALEADGDGPPSVRFVYVHPAEHSAENPDEEHDTAGELLDRVVVWAREDAGERELAVETTHLGTDRYIFSPSDVAQALVAEASAHGIGVVTLDPEYNPGIGAPLVRPLERELAEFGAVTVETAPVTVRTRRTPLLDRTSLAEIGALFVISFGFYQVLAGNFTWLAASPSNWADEIYWLDIVTGAVSASVTAVALSQVVLSRGPTRQTLARLGRTVLYLPYLLLQILKANILVAAVILHPRLPIEPRLTRIRPALWGSLPVTTLANSITLTPGTLTVRVSGRHLLVHTLVPAAREDLFDGGLERAIRFVFYGRGAMQMPGLRERGEAELVASDRVRPDGDAQDIDAPDSGTDGHADGPAGRDEAPDTDGSNTRNGGDDTRNGGDDTRNGGDDTRNGGDDTDAAGSTAGESG
jgi:multicomponent Na+:H+ antiporter subunit E